MTGSDGWHLDGDRCCVATHGGVWTLRWHLAKRERFRGVANMPHVNIACVAGDGPGNHPRAVFSGDRKVGGRDIAVNLLVGNHAGNTRRGATLLVANGNFEVVGHTVGGLRATVGVRSVFVSNGCFETIGAVSSVSTDADHDAVGVQQRARDVPGHGDGATFLSLSAESADGSVRDGRLGEFATHQHHHTCRHDGAVGWDIVGEHLRAGVNIGGLVVKDDPLAGAVDVPQ